MTIDRIKFMSLVKNVKLTIVVAMFLNALVTLAVIRYAGDELLWTMANRGIVNREMVRVNKLAADGRVLSPIPFE